MSSLAPRWAFNVQAIHSAGDPHLAPGVHLRILPSALLGLPVAPFFVYRHGLGPGGNKAQLRTDVAWTDPLGVPLTPPFTVTPTRPATGWLPPAASGVCCWIALNASGVRSEIVVGTPRGPAAVAASKTAPYPLGASRIEQVVVSGKTGQVSGASWIDARPFTPGDGPFRVLPLPPPGGARYSGPPDAADQAKKRVRDGAPLKFGLHDDPTVSGPATAAAATADDEEKRVFALVPEVEDWVKNLIDDTTGEPWLLARTAAVRDQVLDRDIGQAQINYLGSVLNASLDPGVGRWLGFVDVDREPPGNTPGDVVGYVVRSFWQLNEKRLGLLP
ncbi:MAG TPA: hypothetical protein VKE74_12155, partial [Gemmataceae bacterium]|nr:hypothetical protein [Gemmataceae bacterium]